MFYIMHRNDSCHFISIFDKENGISQNANPDGQNALGLGLLEARRPNPSLLVTVCCQIIKFKNSRVIDEVVNILTASLN